MPITSSCSNLGQKWIGLRTHPLAGSLGTFRDSASLTKLLRAHSGPTHLHLTPTARPQSSFGTALHLHLMKTDTLIHRQRTFAKQLANFPRPRERDRISRSLGE